MDSILNELNFPPNPNLNLSSNSILGTSFINNVDNNLTNEKNNIFLSDASSIVFDENEFNTSLNKSMLTFPKKKRKRTKKDLDLIPLPLFDCIYCANEKIVFNRKINKELYKRYDNQKEQSEKVINLLKNELKEKKIKEELNNTIMLIGYKEEIKKEKKFINRKRNRKATHKKKQKM